MPGKIREYNCNSAVVLFYTLIQVRQFLLFSLQLPFIHRFHRRNTLAPSMLRSWELLIANTKTIPLSMNKVSLYWLWLSVQTINCSLLCSRMIEMPLSETSVTCKVRLRILFAKKKYSPRLRGETSQTFLKRAHSSMIRVVSTELLCRWIPPNTETWFFANNRNLTGMLLDLVHLSKNCRCLKKFRSRRTTCVFNSFNQVFFTAHRDTTNQ